VGVFQGAAMTEVKNLRAGYNGSDVIRAISFKVEKGKCLCVLGPNGCGKSTLLKAIARIIDYRGQILIDGGDISAVPRKQLAQKIALLSQNMQVFFPYTVYETVSMGRYAYSRGFLKNLSAKDTAIINDTLKKLDLWDSKDRMIDELSGGTLQRVFLAKTLAQTPRLILLDEPANHLDLKHQIALLDYLKAWVKENNAGLIGVFHDLNLARYFGDTAIVLDNGNVAVGGTIEEVLNSAILETVYGIDIRAFMQQSLEKWKTNNKELFIPRSGVRYYALCHITLPLNFSAIRNFNSSRPSPVFVESPRLWGKRESIVSRRAASICTAS
jgi:iron complex transport system ATP-binding protein